MIVPGQRTDRPVSEPLVAALRTAHARGARLVSICSGAFALAAAGLLDGRGRPPTGATPASSSGATPACASTPTSSTSTTATS